MSYMCFLDYEGTLSATGHYTVLDHVREYDIRFDTVLIDEAAQATEPATLIPLRYGCKTLVLGMSHVSCFLLSHFYTLSWNSSFFASMSIILASGLCIIV